MPETQGPAADAIKRLESLEPLLLELCYHCVLRWVEGYGTMNGWMDGWMDRTVTPSFMLSLDMEEGDEDFFFVPSVGSFRMPNRDGKNLIEGKNQGERIILYYRKYIVTFFLRDIDGLERTESEKLKMSFGLMLLGLGVYFILHFSTPSVYTGGGWSEKSHLLAWLIFSRFTFSLPYIVSVMVQGRLRSVSLASEGPKTEACQNQNHPVTRPGQARERRNY